MRYTLTEAKANLSKLLDQVENGEEVIIIRNGKPTARLERIVVRTGRLLGQHRGEAVVPDDSTFRAMSDQEADAFWEGR